MEREENSPGNEPDREEHLDHHAQEADEEVGIHAIVAADVFVVGFQDGHRPAKERPGQGCLAVLFFWNVRARFVDGLEAATQDGEDEHFNPKDGCRKKHQHQRAYIAKKKINRPPLRTRAVTKVDVDALLALSLSAVSDDLDDCELNTRGGGDGGDLHGARWTRGMVSWDEGAARFISKRTAE